MIHPDAAALSAAPRATARGVQAPIERRRTPIRDVRERRYTDATKRTSNIDARGGDVLSSLTVYPAITWFDVYRTLD
jgi:hypothetical protein